MKEPVILGVRDRKYLIETYKRGVRNQWIERYFKESFVYGLENLQVLKGQQFMGFSNHLSHFDYIALGRLFLENLPVSEFPRIIAGRNLDSWILSAFGLCFRRMGVFFIDRERIARYPRETRKAYLERIDKRAKGCLKRGESLFDFPGAGRDYFRRSFSSMKNGIQSSLIDSGVDMFILIAAVDYDRRIEEPVFPILSWAKEKKVFRWMYYTADAASFLINPLFREYRGNIYINFKSPKRLSEIATSQNLRQKRGQLNDYLKEEIDLAYNEIQERKGR